MTMGTLNKRLVPSMDPRSGGGKGKGQKQESMIIEPERREAFMISPAPLCMDDYAYQESLSDLFTRKVPGQQVQYEEGNLDPKTFAQPWVF